MKYIIVILVLSFSLGFSKPVGIADSKSRLPFDFQYSPFPTLNMPLKWWVETHEQKEYIDSCVKRRKENPRSCYPGYKRPIEIVEHLL